jgi:hypothetical protein
MPLGEGPILILENVGRQHSGTYQCRADNSVREAAYADVNLKVLCKYSRIKLVTSYRDRV